MCYALILIIKEKKYRGSYCDLMIFLSVWAIALLLNASKNPIQYFLRSLTYFFTLCAKVVTFENAPVSSMQPTSNSLGIRNIR